MPTIPTTAERLSRVDECLEYQANRAAELPEGSHLRANALAKIERLKDEKAALLGQKEPIARSKRPVRVFPQGGGDHPAEPIEEPLPEEDLPATPVG